MMRWKCLPMLQNNVDGTELENTISMVSIFFPFLNYHTGEPPLNSIRGEKKQEGICFVTAGY